MKKIPTAVLVFVVALLGALAAPSTASAQGGEAEGRRHFKAGQDLYRQGRFLEAAREFEAGYAAAPRPLFLLNIGHAYRRAQEWQKAKDAYQRLLQIQPTLEQRAEVEGYIKSIDDALQATNAPPEPTPVRPAPAPQPPPPPPAVETPPIAQPSPPLGSMIPSQPSSGPSLVETAPPPAERDDGASESVFRKPWFWVVAGVVVAGGVAAAVIALRPDSSCPGTLCISERSAMPSATAMPLLLNSFR